MIGNDIENEIEKFFPKLKNVEYSKNNFIESLDKLFSNEQKIILLKV